MKLETLVYDSIKKVIPKEAERTIIYANISDTSYEIFFYCRFAQIGYQQCYELAEEGVLNAHLLDITFSEMAHAIRSNQQYHTGQENLFTFIIGGDGVKSTVEYLDRETRIYQVKKAWREQYLQP